MTSLSTEIPQADDLERVLGAVAALDAGCFGPAEVAEALDIHERQGSYYLNAAATLGLVSRSEGTVPTEWNPTDQGAAIIELKGTARAAAMSDAVMGYEDFDTFMTSDGPQRLRREWEMAGLGEDTIVRRLQTLSSWAKFLNSEPSAQSSKLDRVSVGARRKAPDIVARRKPRRNFTPEVRTCDSCGMQIPPALTACEMC